MRTQDFDYLFSSPIGPFLKLKQLPIKGADSREVGDQVDEEVVLLAHQDEAGRRRSRAVLIEDLIGDVPALVRS